MSHARSLGSRSKAQKSSSIHCYIIQLTIYTLAAFLAVFITNRAIEKQTCKVAMTSQASFAKEIEKIKNQMETGDLGNLIDNITHDLLMSVSASLFTFHNQKVFKVGSGYCRMYENKMPWKEKSFCISTFGQCHKICEIAKTCEGFAIAEKPVDTLDSCSSKNLGRCIIYLEDHPVGRQIYSSMAYNPESKAYDCYRYGESHGHYYFPLVVSDARDPSVVERWAMVLSTQGDSDGVARTGANTRTFGGLFDENHRYHFEFSIDWEAFINSKEENETLITFVLLEPGKPKTQYRGRLTSGSPKFVQLLTHAKSHRKLEDGQITFSEKDS